ncbi:hypothetical protein EV175_003052 [Coemansia sp. RSA 1933]|nr:hypothetical protein EV175_003052 [Coemansia sp. RSA 1933]
MATLLENAQFEIRQLQSQRDSSIVHQHAAPRLSSSLQTSPAPSTGRTAFSVDALLVTDPANSDLEDVKRQYVHGRDSFAEHTAEAHPPRPIAESGRQQQCTLPSIRQYMSQSLHLARHERPIEDSSSTQNAAAACPSQPQLHPLQLPPRNPPPDHADDGRFYMYRDSHNVAQTHQHTSLHEGQQQCVYQPQQHPQPSRLPASSNVYGNSSSSRAPHDHNRLLLADGNASSIGNRSIGIDVRPHGKRRKRHHDIASKIRSVQPVPRDQDGNYEMPVQVGILTVLRLGKVIWDRDAYHNERYIWPVGYTVQREYYSMTNPNKNVIYTCWITDGGDAPMFHVEAEDMPGAPIVAPTATGAWTAVLRTVNQIRHREHSNSASGPDYFGFSHPTIAKMIQDLPGADKCKTYIVQHFVEMKDRHVRGVVKKGRGGRPSVEMLSRGQRALMATTVPAAENTADY